MISASQIRAQIAAFLDDRLALDSFEDWIVGHTWNVHQSGSVAAEEVTFAIEEALSEFSSRQINYQRLRDQLRQILSAENKIIQIGDRPRIQFVFSSEPSVRIPLDA